MTNYTDYWVTRVPKKAIFTVGEAVRSTCGKREEEENEEDHFQKLRFLMGTRATGVGFGKITL